MGYVPVEERLRILGEQLFHTSGVSTWCFGTGFEFFASTSSIEDDLLDILEKNGCLAYVRKRGFASCSRPVFYRDFLGLCWFIEGLYDRNNEGKQFPRLLLLVGPMLESRISSEELDSRLRSRPGIDSGSISRLKNELKTIPVVHRELMDQYGVLLHYTLTEEGIHPWDFIYPEESLSLPQEPEALPDRTREARQILQEEEVLGAIRDGNEHYLQVAESGRLSRLIDTGNSLRDEKDSLIAFTVLCFRAAVEGGVSSAGARQAQADILARIEACPDTEAVGRMTHTMLKTCTDLVRARRDEEGVSPIVRTSCDYIRANAKRPITVADVAAAVGYTEYYFTKKFYKETGVRLKDYIKKTRVELAKIALTVTGDSVEEISASLQFGNRNYFSRVFREETGMTPMEYRQKRNFQGERKNDGHQ